MSASLKFALISVFFCISHLFHAQFMFEYAPNSIPVTVVSHELENPFGGGLNYAQVGELDFDYDGDLDLVVFDRTNHNIRVFENREVGAVRQYVQNYNASQYFPAEVRYRLFFADYDLDGKNDLFTYGVGGIAVYRNVGDAGTGLQWELVKPFLKTDYNGFQSNLYVSSSDIPAIIDVDNDSDLDVLTFGINGQHVEYHQNQSMELYGIPDSLVFIMKNQCWGLFSEDMNTNSILLNDNSAPCTSGNVPNPMKSFDGKSATRHAGSTVLALDYD